MPSISTVIIWVCLFGMIGCGVGAAWAFSQINQERAAQNAKPYHPPVRYTSDGGTIAVAAIFIAILIWFVFFR